MARAAFAYLRRIGNFDNAVGFLSLSSLCLPRLGVASVIRRVTTV